MQPITLNFSGKSVRLLTLLDQLKTLPTINVSHDELAKDRTFANRSRAVDDSEEEVSVYRQDGAYVVLTGRKVIDAAWAANTTKFPARLVSKHALKHMQSMGENTQVHTPKAQFMRPITPGALRGDPQQARLPQGETSDQR
jgi:hypothetical protein